MKTDKIKRLARIYPWVFGLSLDLIFWVPLNTLFLSTVKAQGSEQIVLMNTISSILVLCTQPILMRATPYLGNTLSVRLGLLCLFAANVLFLVGADFFWLLVGTILYRVGRTITPLAGVMLKNNLDEIGASDQYISIRNQSTLVYSVSTMIVSLISGFMFNLHPYLPVICGTVLIGGCLALAFTTADYTPYNRVQKHSDQSKKIRMTPVLWLIVISYGLFVAIILEGSSNIKLFIQENLMKDYNLEKVTVLLSVIVLLSRLGRVAGNLFFRKMHLKFKDKCHWIFASMLIAAFLLLILSGALPIPTIMKVVGMATGFVLLMFTMDPATVLLQTEALEYIDKSNQQSVFVLLGFAQNLVAAAVNLCMSAILMKWPMLVAIIGLLVISGVELVIAFQLFRLLKNPKNKKCDQGI